MRNGRRRTMPWYARTFILLQQYLSHFRFTAILSSLNKKTSVFGETARSINFNRFNNKNATTPKIGKIFKIREPSNNRLLVWNVFFVFVWSQRQSYTSAASTAVLLVCTHHHDDGPVSPGVLSQSSLRLYFNICFRTFSLVAPFPDPAVGGESRSRYTIRVSVPRSKECDENKIINSV